MLSTTASAGLFGTKIGSKIETSITYEILDSQLQIIDSLPQAQTNALLALDAAMRGIKSKKIQKSLTVTISGKQIDAIKDIISNLSVKNVVIDNMGGTNGAASPFSGLITLADGVGRSIQIGFVMLISKVSSGYDVEVVNLNPSFWGAPNMEVFIVEDESVDSSTQSVINNYVGLYKNISSKSLSASAYPSGKRKYIAVVFFKNLIAPNARVKVKLASERAGLEGISGDNYFQVFEGGWVVGVRSFESDLINDVKWLKITIQSDKSNYPAMNDEERLVGLFPLGRNI